MRECPQWPTMWRRIWLSSVPGGCDRAGMDSWRKVTRPSGNCNKISCSVAVTLVMCRECVGLRLGEPGMRSAAPPPAFDAGAMDAADIFANRALIFVAPDGSETLSQIQFGRPYMLEELAWRCDYEVPNVMKRRHGAGIDGLQAFLLTMSLVETLLEAKRSDGWRFLWPDTRDETSPQQIFEAEHFARMRVGT
jgi:hypothetical protein